ncbi:MAG: hypothetical protein COT18_04675 [Elusimicrobia bacterium CG08_land_8_20_14_0_20_59_10]|nr:MAG: hypothetical protein COT18_04675 [Elusimicrobia bacterium CG08_land_8_20_14_0_20_59_10]
MMGGTMRHGVPPLPEIELRNAAWPGLLASPRKAALEKILPGYLQGRRWFGGKARRISRLKISGTLCLGDSAMPLALLRVSYSHGAPQTYLLPLAWKKRAAAEALLKNEPGAAIAGLELSGKRGLLYDAVYDKAFQSAFLSLFLGKRRPRGAGNLVVEQDSRLLNKARRKNGPAPAPRLLKGEQSNTSIVYGSAYFSKLFRRLEKGVNPDIELGARLTGHSSFRGMPPFLAAVSLHRGGKLFGAIGLLQGYTPSRGDSWGYALGEVSGYYKRVLSRPVAAAPPPQPPDPPGPALRQAPGPTAALIGKKCLAMMSLLGKRTAQMHLALSSAGRDPDFRPEPFTRVYQRRIHRSMLGLTSSTLHLLSRKLRDLPAAVRPGASLLLENKRAVMKAFQAVTAGKISAGKIRVHGDFHLGQVLFTGTDFVIIDFEGEPAKPLSERRHKYSALRDVAGMLRSFHYAAWAPFHLRSDIKAGEAGTLAPWAENWYSCVSAAFLRSYFRTAAGACFLPEDPAEITALLKAFLMEKAIYELAYELNNRPDWAGIPLKGLLQLSGTGMVPGSTQ